MVAQAEIGTQRICHSSSQVATVGISMAVISDKPACSFWRPTGWSTQTHALMQTHADSTQLAAVREAHRRRGGPAGKLTLLVQGCRCSCAKYEAAAPACSRDSMGNKQSGAGRRSSSRCHVANSMRNTNDAAGNVLPGRCTGLAGRQRSAAQPARTQHTLAACTSS